MAAEQAGKRGNKQQTVKPVQNAAVAGEQAAVVLYAKASLDGRHGQITELTDDGRKYRIGGQCDKVHLHDMCLFQRKTQKKQHRNGTYDTADTPFDSFVRTDHGTEFAPS